jgi:MFS family permease
MEFIGHFRRLTPVQRNTFVACFLGWSLDAFDFFILTFCVSAIATQFQAKVSAVAEAIFFTLAMRPVGAFLFGVMADKYGRRITLMLDIIAYSVFELASAFAPSLKALLIMRAFFGIAMGGRLSRLKPCPWRGADFFLVCCRKATRLDFWLRLWFIDMCFRWWDGGGCLLWAHCPRFL